MDQGRPTTVHGTRILHWALLALIGAAAVRIWLACYDHSVFWPDEIHQSLEQAHRAAFGYGLVPWEFRDGARSWLFPGVIAGVWKAAETVGVEQAMALVTLARLIMVAASVTAIWFAAKLAAASRGPRAALAVVVLMACFPPAVVFSYRAMSETASAPFVLLGAWFLYQRSPRSAALAGVFTALGCLIRYQNGLFVIVLGAALLLERRWREFVGFVAGGTGVALLGGVLDLITWGRPFHSLLAYVDFNLVAGGASTFGVEPYSYYFTTLWSSVGPLLVLLLGFFITGALIEPVLGGAVLAFVLVHCVMPHKEFRFIVPCLPMFGTVVGIGIERAFRSLRLPNWISFAAAGATTATFVYTLYRLSYGDMGQYQGLAMGSSSVWRTDQEPTLLLFDAGQRSDICGISVLGARAAFTGGYTYLHRDVPLIYESQLCTPRSVNYVISRTDRARQQLPGSYALQRQRGDWGLFRREGACGGSPAQHDQMLEGAADMGLRKKSAEQLRDGSLPIDLRNDAGAFTRGWGHGELMDCEAVRWAAGRRASVEFDFSPSGRLYQLKFTARAHELAGRQHLGVAINGQVIHVGDIPASFQAYVVDIPAHALQPGPNRIEFAFATTVRASPTDTRELAALFKSLEIVPRHDDFSVHVALAESQKHLISGFHAPELEHDKTFIWSNGPTSEIEGFLAWPRTPYVLELLAESVPLVPKQRTRVFANNEYVGTINIPTSWSSRILPIPAKLLRGGSNRIRFEYEATVRPANHDRELRDERELAVRFRRIVLSPLRAPSSLDFGTGAARPFLFDGWSVDERSEGRTVVWSSGSSAVVALNIQDVVEPQLRLIAQAYSNALPMAVSILVNGVPVGSFSPTGEWDDVAIPLSLSEYSGGGDLITFEFDHTERPPVRNHDTPDRRELALRVDKLWVESRSGGAHSANSQSPHLTQGDKTPGARGISINSLRSSSERSHEPL